jgi:hypothetical protein
MFLSRDVTVLDFGVVVPAPAAIFLDPEARVVGRVQVVNEGGFSVHDVRVLFRPPGEYASRTRPPTPVSGGLC